MPFSIKNILNPDIMTTISDPHKQKITAIGQLILSAILNNCIKKEGIAVKKYSPNSADASNAMLLNMTSAYISSNMIRGIQYIRQPLASDNLSWKFADSLKVLCLYLLDWATYSYNFYCRE